MIHCLISYEHCTSDDLDGVFEEMYLVEEHFDASHFDGSEVYALSVNASEKDKKKWKAKIQKAVWKVNGGAYCDIRFLTGDEFDEYC